MHEGIVAAVAPRAWAWLLLLIAFESIATAGMPDRSWRGVERVSILCDVDAGQDTGGADIARDLCDRIVRIARPSSPLPMTIVDFGSPALQTPRSVTLVVQASVLPASDVVPGANGRVLSWTMRTTGTGLLDDEKPNLLGAAPRVAPYVDVAIANADLDRGLCASLADVLPWMRAAQVQYLDQPVQSKKGYPE